VHSIGAGGGSIAWIDAGGLLRVGPQSAGADPGPACYGRGGTQPTVTDAALVLGYLHPDEFLGGRMRLDADAARATVATIGDALGQTVEQAASAILSVANAHMVAAIREVTIDRGVDPRDCLIVAGGGAAGLAISEIARELGCRRVLVPLMAGTLSAVGAHHSSIVMEFTATLVTDTARFDHAGVQRTLGELNAQAERFSDELRARGVDAIRQEYSVDARYQHQVWDLEIGLGDATIGSAEDVALLCERFDAAHLAMFSVNDPGQVVETSTWRVRIVGEVAEPRPAPADDGRPGRDAAVAARTGYFPGLGWIEVPLHRSAQLQPGQRIDGPAIVATSTSTLVAHPGDAIVVTEGNDFLLEVAPA
jgi:N-methylhydantoinase A